MRYLAFDFDGTIVDSNFAICEAMERACIRNGAQYVGDTEFTKMIGLDLEACIRNVTDEVLTDEQVAGITRSYRETFKYELVNAFIGIKEVLEECIANGDRIGISTSRRATSLKYLLEKNDLDQYFRNMVSGDQVINPKPNPETLLKLSEKFECKPQELILIGDTMWDMEMANSIGAFTIGVTWGSHGESQLLNAGAEMTVDTPEELQKYFAGLM